MNIDINLIIDVRLAAARGHVARAAEEPERSAVRRLSLMLAQYELAQAEASLLAACDGTCCHPDKLCGSRWLAMGSPCALPADAAQQPLAGSGNPSPNIQRSE